ncbi:metal-dependent hydrolase [Haloarchaeobius sp. DFWS5]|uniref:metal-dependent hydrolase n=1 Tax=Haloarchaeobius sp. DFWS5 TaxID=3446114 RepID=UPI003EB6C254
MYRTGHYGVSLLLYAPVGAALVLADATVFALVGGAVVLGLTPLPDYDLRVPFIPHRGPTHSFVFAAFVGAVVGAAGFYGAPQLGLDPQTLGTFGFAMGAFAIVGHLAGDVITPMGIEPFWPLSSKNFSLRLTTADNRFWNWGLLTLGVFVTVVTVGLLVQSP